MYSDREPVNGLLTPCSACRRRTDRGLLQSVQRASSHGDTAGILNRTRLTINSDWSYALATESAERVIDRSVTCDGASPVKQDQTSSSVKPLHIYAFYKKKSSGSC